MTLIVFIDDNGGMMFNHRRQSQDRVAMQRILDMTAESTLWMNEYSAGLFAGANAPQIQIDQQFLDKAGPGDYCLVENEDVSPYLPFIGNIVLFHWNRVYPADVRFPIKLKGSKWRCISAEDFTGSSHEKITLEVYTK